MNTSHIEAGCVLFNSNKINVKKEDINSVLFHHLNTTKYAFDCEHKSFHLSLNI